MRRSALGAVAMLLATGQAMAALPPHYERQAELTAIIEAAVEALGVNAPIETITMTGTDAWTVGGGGCTVKLTVVDVPRPDAEPGFAGPRNFAVEASRPVCR